jgi:pimeloyl-ACP methyl ester carboxylesterase
MAQSLRLAVENSNVDVVNTVVGILSDLDANMRFNLNHGMWTTEANSAFELIQGSKQYAVKDIAQNIKCPTLVLEAEKDESFPGQPKKAYDALTCPKKYILFTVEEGAEEHCQCGAPAISNQRIFDWLDETLE